MKHLLSIPAILIVSFFIWVSSASAHSTEPRVEISIERTNPGAVVDVRGVSFGMDDSVTLSLIGTGVDVPLGEILANAEGEFTHIVVLPTDLVEGTYFFRAVNSHHYVLSSPLTVWGTALGEGGEQGPRDDDDALLAPMPTFAPGVVPGGVVATSVPQMPEATPASNWNTIIVALATLTVLGIAVGFGIKRKNN